MVQSDTPKSVLVYVSSTPDDALGENLIKLPFLQAIRDIWPETRLTLVPGVGPAHFQNVLRPYAEGVIDDFITDLDIGKNWREILRNPLPGRRFDLILDTQHVLLPTLALRRIPHRRFISSTGRFILSDARPPRSMGKPGSLLDKLMQLLSAAAGRPVVARFGCSLPEEYDQAAKVLLPVGPLYVGLAPGAGNTTRGKVWPLGNFLALAREQLEKGRVPVFLLGPAEEKSRQIISQAMPQALMPRLDGQDGHPGGPALTTALARRLAVAVANCSGTGHMMALGEAPLVSLFGPTSARKFRPFTPFLTALRAQDFGEGAAIENIPVAAVAAAVDAHIARWRGHNA